ncbi:DUF2798 domain-containing protein [Mesobacterium pallidum]|uniref:DUF2798 domain-containing protein n=1 Tax=Mesobacterium pallidum TaxID=2872037 RepID=UPI001EE1F79A|nr:DUF2798 domain-containing protein [Mesobacterium pallidum]
MLEKRIVILSQLIISCLMAFSMSGIMGLIHMGATREWLAAWPATFAMAWPIAFVLSLGVGPLAFWLARRTLMRGPA